MSAFRMKPKHLIAVPQFDEEHRQLFEICDLLRRQLIRPESLPTARQTFVILENHTRIHFANEERVMQRIDYPEFHTHRQIHRHLLGQLADMSCQLHDWRAFAAKSFNTSLAIWLIGHIATEDAKLGKYINSPARTILVRDVLR